MACALQGYMMQTRLILTFILTIFFFKSYSAEYGCLEAAKKYERLYELPQNLLLSMSLIESGRKLKNGEFVSWPWTINIKGKGKFFKDKKSATNFVKNYVSEGKKNIDIGCMQINYMYHPNVFKNFDDAFEPEINVKESAILLKSLYRKFGSWKEAVGYYHSYRTSKRIKYSSKVFKKWLDIKEDNQYTLISSPKLEITNISVNESVPTGKNIVTNKEKFKPNNLEKQQKKNKNKQEQNKLQNPYLVARMEKIRFFRNYFLQTKNN